MRSTRPFASNAAPRSWDKVRSFVRNSVAGIVRWGLLLAVLAGVVCGGYYLWQNHQVLKSSRTVTLTAVNQKLVGAYEPVSSLDFTNTSLLQPIPRILWFKRPLYKATEMGRQSSGTLKGRFDRVQGTIEVLTPFRVRNEGRSGALKNRNAENAKGAGSRGNPLAAIFAPSALYRLPKSNYMIRGKRVLPGEAGPESSRAA